MGNVWILVSFESESMYQLKLVREIPEECVGESLASLLATFGFLEVVIGDTTILGIDAKVCRVAISPNDPQGDDIAALHALFYRRAGENVSVTTLGAAPSFCIDGRSFRDAKILRSMKRISFGEISFRIVFEKMHRSKR